MPNDARLPLSDASVPQGSLPQGSPSKTAATSNVLELSVGELSGALKRTIEDRFGFVRVRGEISNYRGPHSSGHAYFCLKDDVARIDAVIWKTSFLRLKTKPQEGLEIIATGRVTTFPGKSTYQILIEAIEPAGIGALMAVLEARRKALAAEGLFDAARKQPIPFLPMTIGVVTSPTGAVIRDIIHRVEDRFPCRILVWPVRVQGETAAAEIAAGIEGFNSLEPNGPIARPDVLIVARGGGSLEDLWAFNEEVVVRAAAASAIPLIAAVGHETDWTLIDHAADLRAPTPSGAAEKAVPVRSDLLLQVADRARRLAAGVGRRLERFRTELRPMARALASPEASLAFPRQRTDAAGTRLAAGLASARDKRHLDLARLSHRLAQQAPRMRLAQQTHGLQALHQRLVHCRAQDLNRRRGQVAQGDQRLKSAATSVRRDLSRHAETYNRTAVALMQAWRRRCDRRGEELRRFGRLLETLGYRQVLSRGFALVRDAEGHPVRSARNISTAVHLDIEFADGHIDVVTGGAKAPRPVKTLPQALSKQESLF